MKRKISLFLLVVLTILFSFLVYTNNSKTEEVKVKEEVVVQKEEVNYEDLINNLKNTYNNQDIIGIVEIPNVLKEILLQTSNTDYYLKHDIYNNYNDNGAAFLDYRNNIRESNKLLIYGHSDPYGELPFVKITNYNNQSFLQENPYIYITDSLGKRKYEVFSSYIETQDFDYVNLESFGGLTYKEHLLKLKKKSLVNKDIKLEEDSKILILQTCSFNENISAKTKYQLVISKEIEEG